MRLALDSRDNGRKSAANGRVDSKAGGKQSGGQRIRWISLIWTALSSHFQMKTSSTPPDRADEADSFRKVALFGVCMATTSCILIMISMPMIYSYVQQRHTFMLDELRFCQSRANTILVETAKTTVLQEVNAKLGGIGRRHRDVRDVEKAVKQFNVLYKDRLRRQNGESEVQRINRDLRRQVSEAVSSYGVAAADAVSLHPALLVAKVIPDGPGSLDNPDDQEEMEQKVRLLLAQTSTLIGATNAPTPCPVDLVNRDLPDPLASEDIKGLTRCFMLNPAHRGLQGLWGQAEGKDHAERADGLVCLENYTLWRELGLLGLQALLAHGDILEGREHPERMEKSQEEVLPETQDNQAVQELQDSPANAVFKEKPDPVDHAYTVLHQEPRQQREALEVRVHPERIPSAWIYVSLVYSTTT
ncbi:unnamed protein product [Bursaphelenchus xylophilus]|uniref:(pine wood nematode) hypothetical protein n=1 Tax=Bursaphelenchus xylophilus TaxID=6326 RepID=A0A7I8X4H7_BURXY|nr:unnamed protein product [Bursaphelenchus xylophilus]CAG9129064.1 unnamed protein product [Bursaphelenchus xylophilus]